MVFFSNKFKVLIVDDDRQWRDELKDHLEECSILELMEPIHSGDTAIKEIGLHRPDAIVLDLILPDKDGLYVLDYISVNMPSYKPVIYVMSLFRTNKINCLLRGYEVDYYSIKPVDAEFATNTLCDLLIGDPNAQIERLGGKLPDTLDWIVEDYLRGFGTGTATIPVKCMRVAIEICVLAGKDDRLSIMEVYDQVGKTFTPSLSSSAVERNIRAAVAGIKKIRAPLYEKYFTAGFPVNNGTFVLESANIIRRQILASGNNTILAEKYSKVPLKR